MKGQTVKSIVAGIAVMLAVVAGGTLKSSAHEMKLGDLVLSALWSRATPPGAKVGAAYLTIENKGKTADRLIGLSSPVGQAEVHEMTMKNGVMSMRPVDGGLDIPPGKKVVLSPGGYHVMLTGLKAPLKKGDMLHITLEFEKAGAIDATFHIGSIGAQGPGGAAGKPGHMDGMKSGSHSGMKM